MGSHVDENLVSALSKLWQLDVNRLVPGRDYTLDAQQHAHSAPDAASAPFITHVDPAVWQRPTFATFKQLLDNYTATTGVPERSSAAERAEEDAFLAAVCDTDVIRFAYDWLSNNSSMRCSSMDQFSAMLKSIWFQYYSRDASRDSSGFEHVFCGELDDDMVKGLHNFVQVYLEEQRGNFNYRGYLDVRGEPCREPPPPEQQLITVRFEWLGKLKPVSSMFVGVSPEFELALYTMMFVAGQENLELDLGPYRSRIKVYQMAGKIGTAYPELLAVDRSNLGNNSMRGGAVAAAAGGAVAGGLGFGALKNMDQKKVKSHIKMAQKHLKGRKRKGKGKHYGFEVEEEEEEGEEEEGDSSEGSSSSDEDEGSSSSDEDANGHVEDDMDPEPQDSSSSSESGSEHEPHVEETEEMEEPPADNAHAYEAQPADNAHAYEAQPTDNAHAYEAQPTDNAYAYEAQPTDYAYEAQPADNAYAYEAQPADNAYAYEAQPADNAYPYEAQPAAEGYAAEAPVGQEAFAVPEAFGGGGNEEEGDPMGDLCAECCTIA